MTDNELKEFCDKQNACLKKELETKLNNFKRRLNSDLLCKFENDIKKAQERSVTEILNALNRHIKRMAQYQELRVKGRSERAVQSLERASKKILDDEIETNNILVDNFITKCKRLGQESSGE